MLHSASYGSRFTVALFAFGFLCLTDPAFCNHIPEHTTEWCNDQIQGQDRPTSAADGTPIIVTLWEGIVGPCPPDPLCQDADEDGNLVTDSTCPGNTKCCQKGSFTVPGVPGDQPFCTERCLVIASPGEEGIPVAPGTFGDYDDVIEPGPDVPDDDYASPTDYGPPTFANPGPDGDTDPSCIAEIGQTVFQLDGRSYVLDAFVDDVGTYSSSGACPASACQEARASGISVSAPACSSTDKCCASGSVSISKGLTLLDAVPTDFCIEACKPIGGGATPTDEEDYALEASCSSAFMGVGIEYDDQCHGVLDFGEGWDFPGGCPAELCADARSNGIQKLAPGCPEDKKCCNAGVVSFLIGPDVEIPFCAEACIGSTSRTPDCSTPQINGPGADFSSLTPGLSPSIAIPIRSVASFAALGMSWLGILLCA